MTRLLPILLALALAGCLGGGDEPATDPTPTPMPTPEAILPPPIEDSQTVAGGADPLNFVGQPVCSTPTAGCIRYAFDLNTTATITADLTWTIPANDFDLYLFQDGAPSDVFSGAQPPGTSEGFEAEIEPGSYELVVVPWAVSQDTFTVAATFEAVTGPAPANTTLVSR